MNRRTRVVLDTLLPGGEHPVLRTGAADPRFATFLEGFESTAPPRLRLGFRAGVLIANWVSPLLIGRVPPLSLHRRSTRERALEAMSRTYLLRQLLLSLKLVVASWYGADPDVRAAIGYRPPGGRA